MAALRLAALGLLAAAPLAAQNRRCQLVVENVDRRGVSAQVTETSRNYFAGGNVRLRCRGQDVRIWTDSLASYTDQVVQFIGHFRYEDDQARVTSDFGTYYRDDEKWEATGNVVYTSRRDQSKLEGPLVIYRRKIQGVRDEESVYAEQRPTLTLAATDSSGKPAEPYLVKANRMTMRGEDKVWAGGNVTIDRSDLRGRGDSLELDTGAGSAGAIIGHAALERATTDTFSLTGRRIDLGLRKKELTAVTGRDSALLKSRDMTLSGDAVGLRLEARKVVQTTAWGKLQRPRAVTEDYEVRGDSLAIDTPAEVLRELRAWRGGYVGLKPDSAGGQRDYLEGDSITAVFGTRKEAGARDKSVLQRLEARSHARSFYRLAARVPGSPPSITYSRADRIVLTMQPGDTLKVERVEMSGNVDGVQLQPQAARPDSARRDTTRIRPERPRP